jgi:hypothetical protein
MSVTFARWIYAQSKLLTAPVPIEEGENWNWSHIVASCPNVDHMENMFSMLVPGSYVFKLLSLVLLL